MFVGVWIGGDKMCIVSDEIGCFMYYVLVVGMCFVNNYEIRVYIGNSEIGFV